MPWNYIEPRSVIIDGGELTLGSGQIQTIVDSPPDEQNLLDLDSLSAQVAILASDGFIVRTNTSWDAMASGGSLASKYENYLSDCTTALVRGFSQDRPIGEGVAKVLSGRLPAFSDSFSRLSGHKQRIFQITAISEHTLSRRGAAIIHTDITPLQRDPLASISSRELFETRAKQVLDEAKDACQETALMLIELHGVDEVNRTQGRATGEHVTRVLAKRLGGCVREHDVVARLDGGIFAILFRAGTVASRIVPVIARIEAAMREAIIGVGFPMNATVGAALFPQDGTEAGELYCVADKRLR
ncbi:GGDEF domain-containing protein [Methylocella silvestris]|uniref:GGDEF domain-containing protein n=1 Tax=Methylocella silvestris TaxID=199596 RepID=A0A2J7TF32_METSI|nr:GGDEF domain-containing protein [Methylocella silvestris]PNG25378.1 GGDEF domain-containing protein [Methylocella silvestris]